jgi:hypothetical protein
LNSVIPTKQASARDVSQNSDVKNEIGAKVFSNIVLSRNQFYNHPEAVEGERPSLSENLQEPYRTIVCVANCSNTTPGGTVSQSWSEVGERKTFFFKIFVQIGVARKLMAQTSIGFLPFQIKSLAHHGRQI